MPYPTDNPIDGQGRAEGGEVAAGRAAMPEPARAGHVTLPTDIWLARADWIDAEDGTIVAFAPGSTTPTSLKMWPARRPLITAAPQMLAALRLALPELREDLESLVECSCTPFRDWSANMQLPDTLDIEVLAIAVSKKAAYDAALAAIAAAEGR